MTIGDRVLISPYVIVASASHGYSGTDHLGPSVLREVKIGDGVWIAAHVTVTSGVSIGPCTLVGANSTVVKNLEGGHLVSGNPAQYVRDMV